MSDFYFLLPSQYLFHQFVFIMKYFLDPLNGNVSVSLTSDSLTDNDNIARPDQSQLRSSKINSAGLEDYYFIEWTFQALQPLLLLLTVEKIYDWLVCSESMKTSKYDWHHLSALTAMPISGQAAKIFWSEMCFQYYKFR